MKLNCINLFANFANVFKTNKLQAQCNAFKIEIAKNNKKIVELEENLSYQETIIKNLNKNVQILNDDLQDHKIKIQQASDKYYTSIKEMQSMVSFHKKIIKDLQEKEISAEFALDLLISLVSLFLVNTR